MSRVAAPLVTGTAGVPLVTGTAEVRLVTDHGPAYNEHGNVARTHHTDSNQPAPTMPGRASDTHWNGYW